MGDADIIRIERELTRLREKLGAQEERLGTVEGGRSRTESRQDFLRKDGEVLASDVREIHALRLRLDRLEHATGQDGLDEGLEGRINRLEIEVGELSGRADELEMLSEERRQDMERLEAFARGYETRIGELERDVKWLRLRMKGERGLDLPPPEEDLPPHY